MLTIYRDRLLREAVSPSTLGTKPTVSIYVPFSSALTSSLIFSLNSGSVGSPLEEGMLTEFQGVEQLFGYEGSLFRETIPVEVRYLETPRTKRVLVAKECTSYVDASSLLNSLSTMTTHIVMLRQQGKQKVMTQHYH